MTLTFKGHLVSESLSGHADTRAIALPGLLKWPVDDRKLGPMTLTFKGHLVSESLFGHTDTRAIALPGLLKWPVEFFIRRR